MADGRRRRWRVLLMLVDGFTADGYYEHVADELPDEGAIIDVRDTQAPDQVIRARVRHVDERNPLPIAAVEVFPG
jgi:hypothetical protein